MNATVATTSFTASFCPIVELRQYTLHPGKRNILIELFEREFVETQEAVGMTLIGQFRDLDDPDRFVWLRGFADMPSRARALAAFYGGPAWQTHRDVANATMIDSDNVLLLRPLDVPTGFIADAGNRPSPGSHDIGEELVVITLWYCAAPAIDGFANFFAQRLAPLLAECAASVAASFVTEYSNNSFPALPVREGEHVLVGVACFADHSAYARHVAALTHSMPWRATHAEALARYLTRPAETLRLAPTARSLLRGSHRLMHLPTPSTSLSIGDAS
jgi:NIPSNAP